MRCRPHGLRQTSPQRSAAQRSASRHSILLWTLKPLGPAPWHSLCALRAPFPLPFPTHRYLEELGQGIQHVASRVGSLTDYIQRANDMRRITGEGHTFLNIPRTYYGLLDAQMLVKGGVEGELLGECKHGLTEAQAAEVMAALEKAGLVDMVGAVDLDANEASIAKALASHTSFFASSPPATKAMVQRVVRRSCYVNLWKLMKDQLGEDSYLKVVRNKILADVQGEDVLFQIFTSTVLQRKPGTEAPFLEFIERVCAQKEDGSCAPIRPGCGGFGIRNFLTLFLSIEVSKPTPTRPVTE